MTKPTPNFDWHPDPEGKYHFAHYSDDEETVTAIAGLPPGAQIVCIGTVFLNPDGSSGIIGTGQENVEGLEKIDLGIAIRTWTEILATMLTGGRAMVIDMTGDLDGDGEACELDGS